MKLFPAMLRRSLPGPARKQMSWCYQTGCYMWICFWDSGGHLRRPKYYQVRLCTFWDNNVFSSSMETPLMGTALPLLMASNMCKCTFNKNNWTIFWQFAVLVGGKQLLLYAHGTCFSTVTLLQQGPCETNNCMPVKKIWATWEFTLMHFIMSYCYIAQKKGSLHCAAAYLATRPRPT